MLVELIFYQCDDCDGLKVLYYMCSLVMNFDVMYLLFVIVLIMCGIVMKEWYVYFVGCMCIYFDCVDGFGDFIEFEVVFGLDDDEVGGEVEVYEVFVKFGVVQEDFVVVVYVDLLNVDVQFEMV